MSSEVGNEQVQVQSADAGEERLLGAVFVILALAIAAMPYVSPGGFGGVDVSFVIAKLFGVILAYLGVRRIANAGK